MASISNNKMKRETGDNGAYGSPYNSKPSTITIEDREAAEVLLQMGLGMGSPRRNLPEVRSSTSELTLKPAVSIPSSVIVTNGPSSIKPQASIINFSSRSRNEPSAFVPVNLGGYSSKSQSGVSISIHPAPPSANVTPQRVPVSVVQRKDAMERNRRALSPSLNHVNLPAITIRPIQLDGKNREISSKAHLANNPNPSLTASSFLSTDRTIDKDASSSSRPELNGLTKFQMEFESGSHEPTTSAMVGRNDCAIEKTNGASSSSKSNYCGGNISGNGNGNVSGSNKITVKSLLQRNPTVDSVSSHHNQQHNLYSPNPINIGRHSDPHHNPSIPNWIISSLPNVPGAKYQIVSPDQFSSLGGVGGVGTSGGNLLLPGTTLIRITSNNMSKNELNSNNCIENSEVQRIHENKLMKKALRASAPMTRDASEPIAVDEFTIPKEYWAKAFVQSDICHAAGILFKALFTPEEIQNCTLRGRNGTFLLDLKKRSAIFRAVGWMKNKNQNPYSFDSNSLRDLDLLTQDEKMIIEKKVFVERRYQTSRKIRDVPSKRRSNNMNKGLGHNYQNRCPSMHSSEESNPPLEIIIKPEPTEFMDHGDERHLMQNDIKPEAVIKCEIEDVPMKTEEHNNSSRTLASEIGQRPPSPKQVKLSDY